MGNVGEKGTGGKGGGGSSRGTSVDNLKQFEVVTSRDELTLTQHDIIVAPPPLRDELTLTQHDIITPPSMAPPSNIDTVVERDELTLTQHDVVISMPGEPHHGEPLVSSNPMVGMHRVLTQSDVIEDADKYYPVKDTTKDYTGGLMK